MVRLLRTTVGLQLLAFRALVAQQPLSWKVYGDTTGGAPGDRKSTRLNSSHSQISYAVFCLKKKKQPQYSRQRWRLPRGLSSVGASIGLRARAPPIILETLISVWSTSSTRASEQRLSHYRSR